MCLIVKTGLLNEKSYNFIIFLNLELSFVGDRSQIYISYEPNKT